MPCDGTTFVQHSVCLHNVPHSMKHLTCSAPLWLFKDTSRGHLFHLEVHPVARPENGVEEEEKRSCLSLVVHDRWQKEWGRQSGEGQPWLMWRLCGPKNIFPLPSILANVTCHMGHSLQCVCVCVRVLVWTYYGFRYYPLSLSSFSFCDFLFWSCMQNNKQLMFFYF